MIDDRTLGILISCLIESMINVQNERDLIISKLGEMRDLLKAGNVPTFVEKERYLKIYILSQIDNEKTDDEVEKLQLCYNYITKYSYRARITNEFKELDGCIDLLRSLTAW